MTSERGEAPVFNVVGVKVALGPLRRDLVPLFYRWANDYDVRRTATAGLKPVTLDAQEAWYDATVRDESQVQFLIYERATWRPIGRAGLHVDYMLRNAVFDIVIGEKECWGRGYGTEATALVLDHAFTGLGLHTVMLQVDEYNAAGIAAYEKAGFKHAGRRREAHRLGGRAFDVIYMDCLASEFVSPSLGALVPGD